ncbi:MAG: AtpZ/AtpI family protein [Bacteroidota bacterium]
MEDSKEEKKALKSYARYSSIAFQMLMIILAGVFGGRELDRWLELKFPVFTLVLTIAGVILSIYFVIKDLLRK